MVSGIYHAAHFTLTVRWAPGPTTAERSDSGGTSRPPTAWDMGTTSYGARTAGSGSSPTHRCYSCATLDSLGGPAGMRDAVDMGYVTQAATPCFAGRRRRRRTARHDESPRCRCSWVARSAWCSPRRALFRRSRRETPPNWVSLEHLRYRHPASPRGRQESRGWASRIDRPDALLLLSDAQRFSSTRSSRAPSPPTCPSNSRPSSSWSSTSRPPQRSA